MLPEPSHVTAVGLHVSSQSYIHRVVHVWQAGNREGGARIVKKMGPSEQIKI